MSAGDGNDTYIVDNAGDIVIELSDGAAGFNDVVLSSVTYATPENIERLTLTGASNIDAYGNVANNSIDGNSGNNTLNGGGGADTLSGGAGDDTYVLDVSSDVVSEGASSGNDTVEAEFSISLSFYANIENATLSGSANGTLTGTSGDNVLTGNAGNNFLNGGAGADTLIGGFGNDSYVIDNAGDVVSENVGEGVDTVISSISHVLGDNYENLTLSGSDLIDGTGTSGNNTLTGNSAVNTLAGALGDDVYVISNSGAVIVENASGGVDTVESIVNFTLGENIENLTLTGSTSINGTGNNGANTVVGNSGVNVLAGLDGDDRLDGGSGADTLNGGNGNDTYVIDNTGDVILSASETSGTDSVEASVTYSLSTLTAIENITLTGSSAVNATGNALDNILRGDQNTGVNTLTGGAGNDSYYVGAGDIVVDGASAGTDTVYSGLSTYTLTTNVEALVLIGSSDISGTGNTVANVLTGNGGNNTLDGGTGTDTLLGGAGNDTYLINVTADIVSENVSEGTDTVITTVTAYTLAANVENLILDNTVASGIGNSLDNVMTGNSAVNTLSGLGGIDTLDGAAGADKLSGGTGDDVYIVDNASDTITENASEGTDTIRSSVTFTISANVENLILTAAGAINGIGNGSDNAITGGTGDNSLDGAGGTDTLIGGLGNDVYVVDTTGDLLSEASGEGTDTVRASVSYTLSSTQEIENLVLTGTTIDGTGNGLDNTITGSSSVNILSGLGGNDALDGGAGADTMIGGAGNDTFIVDNTGDLASEAASEGIDTVLSSVTFTLGNDVENLTLTATANGTGNSLDNSITGNSGINILTGNDGADVLIGDGSADTLVGGNGNDMLDGGTGADDLIGGAGDDVYYMNVSTDTVTENASEGTDTVHVGFGGYTLGANLENLILDGTVAVGTGNSAANVLTGNSAANTLSGSGGNDTLDGGAGADRLTGGTEADAFVFKLASYGSIDTVTDFSTGQGDILDVRDLLTGFNPGTDAITDWVRITTSGSNSIMEVDRDGTAGTYSWSQIATLTGVTNLTDEAALVTSGNLLAT